MSEHLKPVSKKCTQRILAQMNSNLFGIIKDANHNFICYFVKIKYKNIKIPVMITHYNVIDYIKNNNIITVNDGLSPPK